MYFDSHAHLGEDCFAQDFVHIVENMRTAGVSGMMEIGFDGPSSYHAVELANRYDWIWAAVGSHPDDAAQVDEARIEEYRALCEDPRVKAIGETVWIIITRPSAGCAAKSLPYADGTCTETFSSCCNPRTRGARGRTSHHQRLPGRDRRVPLLFWQL